MSETMNHINRILVDGMSAAVLRSAVFMLCYWPFEKPSARTIARSLSDEASEHAEALHDKIHETPNSALKSRGISIAPLSSKTLRDERANEKKSLQFVLLLTDQELEVAILSLRTCVDEFHDNWHDFNVATTGDLEEYGACIGTLRELASRRELLGS
jgi:hypothetical protein